VTRLRPGQPRNHGSILSRGKIFISSPKIQDRFWGQLVSYSVGIAHVNLTVHKTGKLLHLLPMLIMNGAVPLCPLISSWRAHDKVSFTFTL